jgi:hypothetical protein
MAAGGEVMIIPMWRLRRSHQGDDDVSELVGVELERGDDAEVAADAPDRPEEIGVVFGVGEDELGGIMTSCSRLRQWKTYLPR